MPFDRWQWIDIFLIFRKREVCLNRARGASKTRDMALLCVFFAIRNNEIKWFAPTTQQLVQAKKYWSANPFCEIFNWKSKQIAVITTINANYFEIAITNEGHMKGGRANIVFFDEMALMTASMLGDILPVTNGMDAVGDGIFLIFFSTPLINTIFEDYTFKYPTFIHDWTHASWFVEKRMLRIKDTVSPSKWKTEYMCIFAAAEGQVFEINLVNEPYDGELQDTQYYGSDPNPREGYAVVGSQYSQEDNHIVVNYAWNFGGNHDGKRAMFAFLIPESQRHYVEAELEDNGVGKPVWDDYVAEGGKGYRLDWSSSGAGNKVFRANTMNKFIIHIWYDNPDLTPKEREFMKMLWSQMNAVQWTKDGTKIDKPTNQPWHMSDSLMHCCQRGQNQMVGGSAIAC